MSKIAAIWARASGSEAEEIAQVKEKLESEGYEVPADRILTVNGTGTELYSYPEILTLRNWILDGEIQGVGLLDTEQFPGDDSSRNSFLAECTQAGVHWVVTQGPPMGEGQASSSGFC